MSEELEKKSKELQSDGKTPPPPLSKVPFVNIDEEMKSSYLDYAMSVIVGRALPDVRDGLKPVHRRALFAMQDLGNFHDKPFKKSARLVGDIIGKYHPHGDMAVYNTVVRMAQDFAMRYPLVEGQGNFGSIDGDNAAHMRYTEVRMSRIAEEMLADIDKETVDFGPNYDGSLQEPLVLPARTPNLLINGSSGIAVGMSTNIPPHNITEVLTACIELIDHPEITLEEVIKIIPGPDFPTAGFIYGKGGIKEAYTMGKGIIQMRAKAEIESLKGDKERIVVTELPYQVNKAKLLESVSDLVRNKRIEGITDIRDESNRNGMRVVFEIKRGAISGVILNRLYKLTQLQDSFGIIMLALDNNVPKLLNLKEALQLFIAHRKEVVTRRAAFDLRKAEARAHILEGLKVAIENIDIIIKLIKQSNEPSIAKEALMKKFELSEIQSQAILDMRLQRLTGLERDKIIQEYEEIKKLIKELKEILGNEKLVFGIIKKELQEILKNYGDKRRTKIIARTEEVTEESLIAKEEVIVTISHSGYIKRTPLQAYRSQRRGGKGVKGMGTREEDYVVDLFPATTHSLILCFTNLGKLYSLRVHQIPEAQNRAARGKAIVNLLNLASHDKIKAILPVDKFVEGKYVVMVTRQGILKKTALTEFENVRSDGIRAINFKEGDVLISAKLTDGKQDLFFSTAQGISIRFNEEQVRSMGRTATGVIGIRLDKDDQVVGVEVLDPKQKEVPILTVTENGYGKRTDSSEYKSQSRGGKGIITIKTSDRNGKVIGITVADDESDVMMITDQGQIIRMKAKDISVIGRNTQGVRLFRLSENEKVVAVARIMEEDEDDRQAELIPSA